MALPKFVCFTSAVYIVYIVEKSVGGACMNGKYLIVATGTDSTAVMTLKPVHAGIVAVPLPADLASSHIRSFVLARSYESLSLLAIKMSALEIDGGSDVLCGLL